MLAYSPVTTTQTHWIPCSKKEKRHEGRSRASWKEEEDQQKEEQGEEQKEGVNYD